MIIILIHSTQILQRCQIDIENVLLKKYQTSTRINRALNTDKSTVYST